MIGSSFLSGKRSRANCACPTTPDPYGNTSGVAIVRNDAVQLYFWTRTPAQVLTALEVLGFRISDQPVEARIA